jgi:hypothetical protein
MICDRYDVNSYDTTVQVEKVEEEEEDDDEEDEDEDDRDDDSENDEDEEEEEEEDEDQDDEDDDDYHGAVQHQGPRKKQDKADRKDKEAKTVSLKIL